MIPLTERLLTVTDSTFEQTALEVFRYQFNHVEVYRNFCEALRRNPKTAQSLKDIPFLPIEFFKSKAILSDELQAEVAFESSGTTGSTPSRHFVADTGLYVQSFLSAFGKFYGDPEEFTFLALLPSYLERGNSSLVYMAEKLIKLSGKKESGFFLNEFEQLGQILRQLKQRGEKVILLGVTYALLDFAEAFKIEFPELIIMETGGMKGRREELTREEVHLRLCSAFGVANIHSEYGMTELLSQGYSKGKGIFHAPPWMRILTRDIYDPFKLTGENETGAVNVIDLANVYSCAFIATSDLARIKEDRGFEILGRMDSAELRGCNLMVME